MKESKKEVIHVGPSSPKQELILNASASISIVGGAAGSGKSHMAILFPLKYVFSDPYFKGIIFRRTTSELQDLWDRACELYQTLFPKDKNGKTVLKINQQKMSIRFPLGGVLFFSYMQHEKDKYGSQGKEYTFCLFDEITHFSITQVLYLYGRLRSSRSTSKCQLIGTCNPDPDSFLFDWVKWYIDPETGIPDQTKDGVIRYFVADTELGFIWKDTKEELEDIYGDGDDSGIVDFTFISATVFDNPILLKNNPKYLSTLKANTPVDVARLLHGSWTARDSAGGHMKREWFIENPQEPPWTDVISTVRAFDFAGTLKTESGATGNSPDYTASVKMSKLKNGDYFIHEVRRTRIRFGDWISYVLQCATYDSKGTQYILPIDPNPAAALASSMMAKELISAGLFVRRLKTRGTKLDRARPTISMIMNGGMHILKDCGFDEENGFVNQLDFFYKECEVFDGERRKGESGHDDGNRIQVVVKLI